MTVDEYGVYLTTLLDGAEANRHINDVVMSSVVPPLTSTFATVCRDYLQAEPLLVTLETKTGIEVVTENPAEVGADRIVNAAGAHHLYGDNLIIVDMGTATTFDVVSSAGQLVGVAISPGLSLAASALSSHAAQLGHVALEAPPRAVGKNTVHAMQSGLVFGFVALIEGMVARLSAEMAWEKYRVIGTGGLIDVISRETEVINNLEPWLTLHGLQVIFDLNTGDRES
jgi:type III pantothenate kinase